MCNCTELKITQNLQFSFCERELVRRDTKLYAVSINSLPRFVTSTVEKVQQKIVQNKKIGNGTKRSLENKIAELTLPGKFALEKLGYTK